MFHIQLLILGMYVFSLIQNILKRYVSMPIKFSEEKQDNLHRNFKINEKELLLHSFVIFPMRKTIFGMRGCFPASHGQEMKDLIASRGRRPREAVNVHFQPKWGWKTASSTKNCFSHRENDKWMEYITFFDFAAYASSPPTTRFPLTGFPPSEVAEVTEVKWPRNPKWWKFLMKTCKN